MGLYVPLLEFNLHLVLPKPDTPRRIRVKVVWPDGTAPRRNLLQVFDGNELLKNVGDPLPGQPTQDHRGIVILTGFAERSYDLSARYWIDDLAAPGPMDEKQIALSNHIRLQSGSKPARVKLILTEKQRARDDW